MQAVRSTRASKAWALAYVKTRGAHALWRRVGVQSIQQQKQLGFGAQVEKQLDFGAKVEKAAWLWRKGGKAAWLWRKGGKAA
eukprot:1198877-Pleurochrysis_carterae.AAC.1